MARPQGLTGNERDSFVEWLRQQVETSKGMILEFKQLNLPTTHIAFQGTYIAVCLELIKQLELS
jgi:hypothetical protein